MKTGQTIFFKDGDYKLLDLIIKTFSGSEYIHVGIISDDGKFILESTMGSNRNMNFMSNYENRRYTIVDTSILWNQHKDNIIPMISPVRYGYMDFIAVGVKSLLRRFGVQIKVKDYSGEICSEFVSKCFKLDETKLSPGELFDKMIYELKLHILEEGIVKF
jgi:hypothetical protein